MICDICVFSGHADDEYQSLVDVYNEVGKKVQFIRVRHSTTPDIESLITAQDTQANEKLGKIALIKTELEELLASVAYLLEQITKLSAQQQKDLSRHKAAYQREHKLIEECDQIKDSLLCQAEKVVQMKKLLTGHGLSMTVIILQ